MRAKRTILFRIGAILLLLVIAGIMMVIGRGHTVYIDNKSIDYNGQTYTTPYKVVVYVDGEQVAKLRDKERGMATCIGQTFKMTLEITQEKGGSEEMVDVTVSLPHHMDGIAINLPAYLAALFIRLLRVGGRCACIVPDGVLFGSSKAHNNLRRCV